MNYIGDGIGASMLSAESDGHTKLVITLISIAWNEVLRLHLRWHILLQIAALTVNCVFS